MSHWFLPRILSDEALRDALQSSELALAPEGLPDLSRAQGADQVGDWLRRIHTEAPPEHIAALAQHFWRLAHELLPEDTLIVPVKEGRAYLIGEVTGVYRKEARAQYAPHSWQVKWRETLVPAESVAALAAYAGSAGLTEITDEDALKSLAPYVPALRKGNAALFRWIAIATLIFELIYFWPR